MTNEEAVDYWLSHEEVGNQEQNEAVWAAISALRKQIPVKPKGRYTDFRCGVCGTRVRSGKGSSSHIKDTVCRNCFTRIDWSENGET